MQPLSPDFTEDQLQVKIDVDADAAYIRLRRAPVARTERFEGSEAVLVDRDSGGQLIGVEILGLSTTGIPIGSLAATFGFTEHLIQQFKEANEMLWRAGMSTAASNGGLVPPMEQLLPRNR
jgi:uncharacterized protein YuzE